MSGAATIGSGRDMGIVTLTDGRVKSWGHNLYGQLGDGTTIDRTSAVFVPGVTNAVKSAGGGATYGVVLVGDSTVNQDPTARISGSCTDLTCSLSGSTSTDPDGTIVSYAWDFGDGATATGASPGAHTYDVADTYTVTLKVTDNQGGTHTTTRSVTVAGPVDPPPNADPVAVISGTTCTYLSCPLSGSGSTDDGTIVQYAWNFGDGKTGTGANPGHVYTEAGTWTVTLVVTDNAGATNTTTAQVTTTAPPASAVAYRAGAGRDANTTSAYVVVPASVQAGDQLVLVSTINNLATMTSPSGWTLRASAVDGTEMRSSVWTRTATAALAGSTVRVPLSTTAKASLTVVAYSGAATPSAVVSAVHGTTVSTSHSAPAATVATSGSTVLRYWADKASTTRAWTTPASVTRRTSTTGSGGGLLASVTGDAGGVAAGTVGALTATSNIATAKALAWTIVVPPA